MPTIESDVAAEYERRKGSLVRLQSEVEFALRHEIERANLKVHSVTGRVKSLPSLLEKGTRKGWENPLADATDLVGVRAVVLFLQDIKQVLAIAERTFDIVDREDKVIPANAEEVDSFGYMSLHLLGRLRREHAGPRYNSLKGLLFELQIRTIVMDAWANVSHHLGYKGTLTVPRELRRDFHALSGLFYVADTHFEMFSRQATQSQERATETVKGAIDAGVSTPVTPIPIDADTVRALLDGTYGDRERSPRSAAAEFTDEVLAVGYTDIDQLRTALDKGNQVLARLEAEHPPSNGPRYAAVGAARNALAVADPAYNELMYPGEDLQEYRDEIASPD